jgi:3-methyladenine DNA glycosylase AlkD
VPTKRVIPPSISSAPIDAARADAELISQLNEQLRADADTTVAPAMQAYMKSTMPYLGVRMPKVRRIVRTVEAVRPPADQAQLIATVYTMWQQATYREQRYAAAALTATTTARRLSGLGLLPLLEHMIRTGAWWDHVDDVSHRVGALLIDDRSAMTPVVQQWAEDGDKWIRRSAIICQLQAKHATDSALLSETILANAADPDFFIRKAIGWALRDYARDNPHWVRTFVSENRGELSPLSVREALKRIGPVAEGNDD